MATKEEILGSEPQGGEITKPAPIIAPEDRISTIPAPSKPQAPPVDEIISKYEDLYKSLNPNPTPSQEQLDKEQKKQKRDQIFAAIGDGVSALSNLYFTSKGAPNMYTGKNTMSDRTKTSYEKLLSQRNEKVIAYHSGLVKAKQMDDNLNQNNVEQNNVERSWQRQLGIDTYNQERARASDKLKADELGYKKERDAITDQQKQDAADTANKQWQATYNQNERKIQAAATAKSGSSSSSSEKQTKFALDNGSELAIDNNVWTGSWLQVYDAMLPELQQQKLVVGQGGSLSAEMKENLVKQYWRKSTAGTKKMYELARTETPTGNKPNSEDEDIIDYVPSNNK